MASIASWPFERTLAAGGTAPATRFGYDDMGHLATIRDAAGNLKTQTFDPVDRMLSVTDTNSGTTRFEYDNSGNPTKTTDARGKVVHATYDGANRITAEWDEADEPGTKISRNFDRVSGCTECTNGGGLLVETLWPAGP